MQSQALAFINKLFVVSNSLGLYRMLAEILLPQVDLLVEKGLCLRPFSEPPDLFTLFLLIMDGIKGYLVQKPLRVSVQVKRRKSLFVSQVVKRNYRVR